MKKPVFLFALFFLAGMLFLPGPSMAKMRVLSEARMSSISGQAGITIQADTLGLDLSMDTLYYHDEDGIGGDSEGGYLSLCGITMQGSIAWRNPIALDIVTENRGPGNTQLTGVSLTMTDMTLKIDSFQIDAIRVGPEPGTGPSFGSIGIKNMVCTISGNVKIFAH